MILCTNVSYVLFEIIFARESFTAKRIFKLYHIVADKYTMISEFLLQNRHKNTVT